MAKKTETNFESALIGRIQELGESIVDFDLLQVTAEAFTYATSGNGRDKPLMMLLNADLQAVKSNQRKGVVWLFKHAFEGLHYVPAKAQTATTDATVAKFKYDKEKLDSLKYGEHRGINETGIAVLEYLDSATDAQKKKFEFSGKFMQALFVPETEETKPVKHFDADAVATRILKTFDERVAVGKAGLSDLQSVANLLTSAVADRLQKAEDEKTRGTLVDAQVLSDSQKAQAELKETATA